MVGDCDAPEVGLLHRLVGLLERRVTCPLAHCVADPWVMYHPAQHVLVISRYRPVMSMHTSTPR